MIRTDHMPGPHDIAVEVAEMPIGRRAIRGVVLAKGCAVDLPEGVKIGDEVIVTHGRSVAEWIDGGEGGSQVALPDLRGHHYGGGDGHVVLVGDRGPSIIIGRA